MVPEEGQKTSVPLACGCGNSIVTLVPGTIRVQCPQCERISRIIIKTDSNGEITLDTHLT